MSDPGAATSCPFCVGPAASRAYADASGQGHGTAWDCELCGEFAADWRAQLPELTAHLSNEQRARLTGLMRRIHEGGGPMLVIRSHEHFAQLERNVAPHLDADAVLTRLLWHVAQEAPVLGSKTPHHKPGVWAARLSLYPTSCFDELLTEASVNGWMTTYRQNDADPSQVSFQMRLAGWAAWRERQQGGESSTTVFIATWRDNDIDAGAVAAMCRAVESLGLTPIVGNNLGTDRRITEDIEANIRECRLLIADFTGSRGGVYWEAGFARGLGRPVIYTCNRELMGAAAKRLPDGGWELDRQPWTELLHFDTKQFPHIFWANVKELEDGIALRIRANGWAPARRPASPAAPTAQPE